MKRWPLALALLALPGCLVIRGGGGYSHRGDGHQQAGTFDAELGLGAPVPFDGVGTWTGSALAIVRGGSSSGGWALGGLELARRLGHPPADPRAWVGCAGGVDQQLLGGRLEAGKDDVGRYLGGAVVLRRRFGSLSACPLVPSVSLLLTGGAYLGPVHGPAIGLHLLVGFD
jgi:hypothetical protein